MEEKDMLLGRIMSMATMVPWSESIEMSRASVKQLAASADLSKIRRVYLLGGGTSLYASMVGKDYIEKIGGICAEATPCFSFRAYAQEPLLDEQAMVVGISLMGNALSVQLGLAKAKECGALAVAISGRADTPVAKSASHVILADISKEGKGCKTVSYVQALLATYELALAIGRANGSLSAEQDSYWQQQLGLTLQKMQELAGLKDQMYALAEEYKDAAMHYVLGAGPNRGTAEEAALMTIEMGWVHSQAEELEDFHHGRYRAVYGETPLFFIAPKGRSIDKLIDMLGAANEIDAPTVVMTDDIDNPLIRKLARHIVPMPGGVDEYMTPMLYIMPMFLYAHHIGVARGTDPSHNRYGFVPTAYRFEDHYDAEGNLVKPAKVT